MKRLRFRDVLLDASRQIFLTNETGSIGGLVSKKQTAKPKSVLMCVLCNEALTASCVNLDWDKRSIGFGFTHVAQLVCDVRLDVHIRSGIVFS